MPYLAAAISNLIFGVTIVAVRFAVTDSDALGVAFVRYLFATMFFLPFLVRVGRMGISRGDFLPMGLLGLLQFGVFPITYTYSLSLTYASRGAIVFATVPLLTYLLAWLFRYDSFSVPRLAGTIMGVLGVVTALGTEVPIESRAELWQGDIWMLVTVTIGASYNVLSRPVMRRYPAMTTTPVFFLCGTVFLGAVSLPTGHVAPLANLQPMAWLALIFAGSLGGAIGYGLFNYALEKVVPTKVAIFVPLNPVTASFLSAILLGEPITVWFLLGLACVLAGILLVTSPWLLFRMSPRGLIDSARRYFRP